MNIRQRRIKGLLILGTLAGIASAAALLIRSPRQSDNIALLRGFAVFLQEVETTTGERPSTLATLLEEWERLNGHQLDDHWHSLSDVWGNPIRYETSSVGFLLISYGRDGAPEYDDYWQLRSAYSHESTCDDPNADTVVSDYGAHRGCDLS